MVILMGKNWGNVLVIETAILWESLWAKGSEQAWETRLALQLANRKEIERAKQLG